jgi:hypothetical protein
MGVELVEGRDLFCRDNMVYMRTTEGEQRVHVIYRRIDDEFLDPLQFNPDSVLGIAGVLNAARAGSVVIANAVGNGVGDDKLVYTYVPDMIAYYLNEKPLLPNVATFRCWLDDERTHVLDHLDELVLKPVEGSGGYGILFGPNASGRQLSSARKAIRDDPRGWIAQPVVQLSTVPTKVDDRLVPRHVDLRPFAVNDGEDVFVLPGGLTRVALPKGSLVVNSSQGGGSKDTWVLAPTRGLGRRPRAGPPRPRVDHPGRVARRRARARADDGPTAAATTAAAGGGALMLARNAESLYWIGRYVERADDTARILDVSVHQLLEDATVDADAATRILLGVLGVVPPDGDVLDAWSLTELVGYSADQPASIVSSVSSARGERPWRARGRLRRDVGVPQRHLERVARAAALRPVGGAARVLQLRRRPRRDAQRAWPPPR